MQPPKKLLDQVRDAIRRKHYAYRTEDTYVSWIKQCILYHNKRHPQEMGANDVVAGRVITITAYGFHRIGLK